MESQARFHLHRALETLQAVQAHLDAFVARARRRYTLPEGASKGVNRLDPALATKLRPKIDQAWADVVRAGQLDSDATILADDGVLLNAAGLRVLVYAANGHLQIASGYPQAARDSYMLALQITDVPICRFSLGMACAELGDFESALVHFKRCIELEPEGELALAAMGAVDRIRADAALRTSQSVHHAPRGSERSSLNTSEPLDIATAQSRIKNSAILGGICGLIFGPIAGLAMAARPDGSFVPIIAVIGLPIATAVYGYMFWSLYWSIPVVFGWCKAVLSQFGCGAVGGCVFWTIALSVLIGVPFSIAIVYGMFGGAIYEYGKAKRVVAGAAGPSRSRA